MSEEREFFRHCPACGRRFHIRLVGKQLVDEKKETGETNQPTVIGRSWAPGVSGMMGPVIIETNVPITIDVRDFQYSYICKHCGHEWSEMHTEVGKGS